MSFIDLITHVEEVHQKVAKLIDDALVLSGLLEKNPSLDNQPRKKPHSLVDTSCHDIWADLVSDNLKDIDRVKDNLDEQEYELIVDISKLIAIERDNLHTIIEKSPIHLFLSFFYIHHIDGKKYSRFSIFRNRLTGQIRSFRSFQSFFGLNFLGVIYKVYISILSF